MAGQTEIELAFADGDYLFALKLPQVMELQRLCGAGIFAIYSRVMKGRAFIENQSFGLPHEAEAFQDDVYETIRLGLIGGGKGIVNDQEVEVSALRARQLLETYAHPVPLKDMWHLAAAILYAKVEGYEPQKKSPDEPAPKAKRRKASTKQK